MRRSRARSSAALVVQRRSGTFVGLALAASLLMVGAGSATVGAAPTTGSVQAQTLVSGMPFVPPGSVFSGIGAFGMAFDSTDHLLVSDAVDSGFYSFGPSGSTTPTPITTGNVQTGMTFGKDGQLYAARYLAGNIDQIDPASGAFIRQLNPSDTTFPCTTNLATDPVSGDLFFGQPNSGGACPGTLGITRIENPASAQPTFVNTIPGPIANYVDLEFARDGTLYAVQQGPVQGCVVRITGVTSATPTVTQLACFANFQQEFVGVSTLTLSAPTGPEPTVFSAGPDGTIYEIDQSANTPPTVTPLITLGTRIDDLIVGPDGCLYATQSDGVDRVVPSDGRCKLVPVSVVSALQLRPDAIGSAIVGRRVTLRAHLENVVGRGRHITFTVTGANPMTRVVETDRAGRASFTYRGAHTGTDIVTATATIDSTALASNPVTVHWQLRA
jgi:hypothetical protein